MDFGDVKRFESVDTTEETRMKLCALLEVRR